MSDNVGRSPPDLITFQPFFRLLSRHDSDPIHPDCPTYVTHFKPHLSSSLKQSCVPVEDRLADLHVDVCGLLSVVPPDEGTRVAEYRRGALEARVVDHRALILFLMFVVVNDFETLIAVVWPPFLLAAMVCGNDLS